MTEQRTPDAMTIAHCSPLPWLVVSTAEQRAVSVDRDHVTGTAAYGFADGSYLLVVPGYPITSFPNREHLDAFRATATYKAIPRKTNATP